MAILLITHDLGVVAEMVDEVAVMYGGKIVERGPVKEIFASPQHPYTEALLRVDPVARDALHDAAESDPRHGAEPARLAAGLPVRPPLRLRVRPLRRRSCRRCSTSARRSRRAGCARTVAARVQRDRWRRRERRRRRWSPRPRAESAADGDDVLLSVRGLKKYFPVKQGMLQRTSGYLQAVDGVDLEVRRGETLGLVGESGCGKSTLGRTLLRLIEPTAGEITFDGVELLGLGPTAMKEMRRHMQIVFQDSVGSLDPRMKVGDLIAEGLDDPRDRGTEEPRPRRARDARARRHASRGGRPLPAPVQRRSAAAHRPGAGARAAAEARRRRRAGLGARRLDPVAGAEPARGAEAEFDLTYVFVAHDLAVVGYISDRVAVMYLGRIVEIAPSDELFARPLHPYTMALLSANPEPVPGTQEQQDRADRRRAEPDRPAVGLPLPDALPDRAADLLRGRPDARGSRPGAHGCLPLPRARRSRGRKRSAAS